MILLKSHLTYQSYSVLEPIQLSRSSYITGMDPKSADEGITNAKMQITLYYFFATCKSLNRFMEEKTTSSNILPCQIFMARLSTQCQKLLPHYPQNKKLKKIKKRILYLHWIKKQLMFLNHIPLKISFLKRNVGDSSCTILNELDPERQDAMFPYLS